MESNIIKSGANIFTIPNALSCLRIGMVPVIVYLYVIEENTLAAGYMLILSGLTDVVDGVIARRFHMVSDLGKVLDPFADKLTQAAMMLCLLMRYPLVMLPFILLLIKELVMIVTGILVIKRTGVVNSAQWHGKAATVLLYTMMLLHLFWADIPKAVSHGSVFACTVMIATSFVLYGSQNMKQIKQHKELQ